MQSEKVMLDLHCCMIVSNIIIALVFECGCNSFASSASLTVSHLV